MIFKKLALNCMHLTRTLGATVNSVRARSRRSRRSRNPFSVETLELRRVLNGEPLFRTTRFAVIGDYGDAGEGEQSVASLVKNWNPDFIITLGDNNYPDGAAATIDPNIGQYYHDFIYPYFGSYGTGSPTLTNRFFPSLGNHDWGEDDLLNPDGVRPYLNYFTLPGNERYYDFVKGPVHFFALDSEAEEPDGNTLDGTQGRWLRGKLIAAREPWRLVYSHRPPFTSYGGSLPNCSPGVANAQWMQWPYELWGASAVLSGHIHNYERILKEDEFGFPFPYFVNGTGGSDLNYPFCSPPESGSVAQVGGEYGAMLVEATAESIRFQAVLSTGEVVDTHTIHAKPSISAGDLLVADPDYFGGKGQIVRINPMTGEQSIVSRGGLLRNPFGITLNSTGDILVADADAMGGTGGIIRINPVSGGQVVASSSGMFADPFGIAVDSRGDVIVTDREAFGGSGGIIRVSPLTGEQTAISQGGHFVDPEGIAVGPTGDIFVADVGSNVIIRVNPTTGGQTIVSEGGSLQAPAGIAFTAGGDLIVADQGGSILRVNVDTRAQMIVATGGNLTNPYGVAILPSGDIVVADAIGSSGGSPGKVVRIDHLTGQQTLLSQGGFFHYVGPTSIVAFRNAPENCRFAADLTTDGNVGRDDVRFLLSHFGTSRDATPDDGDVDCDGDVDLTDLQHLQGAVSGTVSPSMPAAFNATAATHTTDDARMSLAIDQVLEALPKTNVRPMRANRSDLTTRSRRSGLCSNHETTDELSESDMDVVFARWHASRNRRSTITGRFAHRSS